VNHNPTSTSVDLAAALAELQPGRKVPVVVKHENGAKGVTRVTLGAYPGT
jgi:hypothetical protein